MIELVIGLLIVGIVTAATLICDLLLELININYKKE